MNIDEIDEILLQTLDDQQPPSPRLPGGKRLHQNLHLPEEQVPPGHSELKLHLPSGALEHLPLLHLAPLPPQSELNEHFEPAESAQRPLLHLTPL